MKPIFLIRSFCTNFSSSFCVTSWSWKISFYLSVNHNPELRYVSELRCVICTGVTLLHWITLFVLACYTWTALSQSESSNLFMYIVTYFISTVIGPNLASCHVKLILVTPLGSKPRKLDAFGSYFQTYCSKTWLERDVFPSQNLQPWNTECVTSGALEGGVIFRRSLASAGLLLFWAEGHWASSRVGFFDISFRSRKWC